MLSPNLFDPEFSTPIREMKAAELEDVPEAAYFNIIDPFLFVVYDIEGRTLATFVILDDALCYARWRICPQVPPKEELCHLPTITAYLEKTDPRIMLAPRPPTHVHEHEGMFYFRDATDIIATTEHPSYLVAFYNMMQELKQEIKHGSNTD